MKNHKICFYNYVIKAQNIGTRISDILEISTKKVRVYTDFLINGLKQILDDIKIC